MQAHFAKFKAGKTEYRGLASFILNPALRKLHPGCDVKAVCQPIIDAKLVHTRPISKGVLYFEGEGEVDKRTAEVNDLIQEAGL